MEPNDYVSAEPLTVDRLERTSRDLFVVIKLETGEHVRLRFTAKRGNELIAKMMMSQSIP